MWLRLSLPQKQERNDYSCLIILFLISEFPVLITFLSFFTRRIKMFLIMKYIILVTLQRIADLTKKKKVHFKGEPA